MKRIKHIDCYYVDNDISSLDNFRYHFKLESNHTLYTFNSVQRFLNKLSNDSKENSFKVVIINNMIISKGLNTKTAIELLPVIKSINKNIEVIIMADSENIDLKATSGNIRPASFVKKDNQSFIILYSIISRLISEHELKNKYRAFNIVVIVSLVIIIVSLLILIFAPKLFNF